MSRIFIPDPPYWTRWFAWYPVWIPTKGGYMRVWWEHVDRHYVSSWDGGYHNYRLNDTSETK